MMQYDDFIRCIIACKNRIPSIVLYTEDQIRDIREFCFDRRRGSILGFDKMYNLGDIYVSPSVYKNKALQRYQCKIKTTTRCEENDADNDDDSNIEDGAEDDAEGDHIMKGQKNNYDDEDEPVFFGPIFVHGNYTETYAEYFGHLSARLMDCYFKQLTLGSDQEKLMHKAMIHCFPGAAVVVCTLHLQDNVQHKLDAVVGKKDKTWKAILRDIFGCSGLTSCSDVISFTDALGKFKSDTLSEVPGEFKT